MKKARLAVLGIALLAGGAALYLMRGGSAPPQVTQIIAPSPNLETDKVLVASRDLPLGAMLEDKDIAWQAWPKTAIAPQMIPSGGDEAKVAADIKGSVARQSFLQGEPIRRDKVVKGQGAGFMSAMLPSGYRAVAINIDSQGATSAGGFILPNDRVDVIRVYRDEVQAKQGSSEAFVSETILRNIRVLAIGQNIEEKNGEKVVVGTNATLELEPRQAEQIVVSQRAGGGNLVLVLRSIMDGNPEKTQPVEQNGDSGLTIVRAGVPTQQR